MARAGTAFCLALMAAAVLTAPSAPAAPAAVRAVISDVDGTLMAFASNSQLSRRNQAALSRAQAAGCLVSVATGRIPGPWYRALCSQLPDLGPGVFCNGALVMEGDTVLHASALPPATVAAVVGSLPRGRVLGKRIGALAVVDVPGHGFSYSELAPEGPSWVTQLIRGAGEPLVRAESWERLEQVHKFVMFTNPEDADWAEMGEVVPLLRKKLEPTGCVVLDCGEKQCEILPPGVNKGTGVQRLLSMLGIETSEAMACGDAVNDVEMLKLVGTGVAMGDGSSLAKAAADVVVAAHTDDGVAEAIERYVL